MKILIIALLTSLILLSSCNKKDYKSSDFVVGNNCEFNIDIYSSAYAKINDPSTEMSYHDVLSIGESVSLRKIDAVEDANIEDVFIEIEIYNGSQKSDYNIMNISNWNKEHLDDNKIQYTLKVDSSFFSN